MAKRRDSKYEPGRRSGAWRKMRVDKTHSFVIGGYTIGGSTFDAMVFGYYDRGSCSTPRVLVTALLLYHERIC